MVKVIIEMDGGVLQNVSANVPIEYVLVDYDVYFRADVNEEELDEEEKLEREDAKFGVYISSVTHGNVFAEKSGDIFTGKTDLDKRINERLRAYNF